MRAQTASAVPAQGGIGKAALAQLIGTLISGSVILLLVPALLLEQPLAATLLQGVCAALVSMLLRAPVWWLPIHLFFTPMALLLQRAALPSWVWLGGFVALLLVFWRTDRSHVPLYLTNATTARALVDQLPSMSIRVIDLGCGDGGLIHHLARLRPDCRFVGYEHAPLTWAWARLRNHKLTNVDIRFGSFWKHSLREYGLAYAFLSPVPMSRLWTKARSEMLPGSRLISNSFEIPGATPEYVLEIADRRNTHLYIYQPGVIHSRTHT